VEQLNPKILPLCCTSYAKFCGSASDHVLKGDLVVRRLELHPLTKGCAAVLLTLENIPFISSVTMPSLLLLHLHDASAAVITATRMK